MGEGRGEGGREVGWRYLRRLNMFFLRHVFLERESVRACVLLDCSSVAGREVAVCVTI